MSESSFLERALGMIGLAKRAGKLIVGSDAVISSVASRKKPYVVLVPSDASDRTKKQLADKCSFYGVQCIELPCDRETLARFVGKKESQISAAAVCERGMAEKIIILVNS